MLTRSHDGWICARDVATLNVPPTIQGLLLSRVDHLPVEARRLLQEAAVLGIGFDRDVLRAMAGSMDASTRTSRSCKRPSWSRRSRALPASRFGGASVPVHAGPRAGSRVPEPAHDATDRSPRSSRRAYESLSGGEAHRPEDIEALGHHFSLGADRRRGARFLLPRLSARARCMPTRTPCATTSGRCVPFGNAARVRSNSPFASVWETS
jgi:adenylate cyclase